MRKFIFVLYDFILLYQSTGGKLKRNNSVIWCVLEAINTFALLSIHWLMQWEKIKEKVIFQNWVFVYAIENWIPFLELNLVDFLVGYNYSTDLVSFPINIFWQNSKYFHMKLYGQVFKIHNKTKRKFNWFFTPLKEYD